MECKHQYFKYENGILVCAQCGKTAGEIKGEAKIEDKIDRGHEDKQAAPGQEIAKQNKIWPPESKRESVVVKKQAKRAKAKAKA